MPFSDSRLAGIDKVVMMTGDSEPVASAVARAVGLTEWKSRLLPEDKFTEIQTLRAAGRKVAMVGDGINDAPALALAMWESQWERQAPMSPSRPPT